MQVKVSADTLRLPAPVRKKNVTRSNNNLTMKAKINATTEIKLLGQTVEEACANLDQFLDQAVLSGLHQLRIVHGKGTGALRTAVHKMLKSDSRVSNFQLAAFGEGDSGVTIVQLK
jgi:DNA mismatch repair protein MutS2